MIRPTDKETATLMTTTPTENGEPLGIGEAVQAMREGRRVARRGWNGADMWLAIRNPGDETGMGRPFVYIRPVDGQLTPWVASQLDLLATDWFLVD